MLQNVPAYLETCYPTTTTSCAKKKKISDNFFNSLGYTEDVLIFFERVN